jgi:hypothetical protein
MPDANRELAERLLHAQVAFLAAQLEPARFVVLLEQEIDLFLTAAEDLTVGAIVNRDQIKDVARKYALTFDIPGSIPELASEIADRIYRHPAQAENRLGDIIAKRHIEAFSTKLLELPLVQERLMESPLLLEIVSELLFRIASDTAAQNRQLAGQIPGLSSLLGAGGSLLGKVAPDAAVDVEVRMRELSAQMAKLMLRRAKHSALDEPWVHDTVIEAWRERSDQPVSSLRDYMTQEDLEDLLVLVYDFWLSFRETDYISALIGEGVDFFFDTYADFSVRGLIEEFGVSRADLIEEAHRFGPPAIEVLRANGMLEAFLRRQLEPFFLSESTLALLD